MNQAISCFILPWFEKKTHAQLEMKQTTNPFLVWQFITDPPSLWQQGLRSTYLPVRSALF